MWSDRLPVWFTTAWTPLKLQSLPIAIQNACPDLRSVIFADRDDPVYSIEGRWHVHGDWRISLKNAGEDCPLPTGYFLWGDEPTKYQGMHLADYRVKDGKLAVEWDVGMARSWQRTL